MKKVEEGRKEGGDPAISPQEVRGWKRRMVFRVAIDYMFVRAGGGGSVGIW